MAALTPTTEPLLVYIDQPTLTLNVSAWVGQDVRVTVRPARETRSERQNRYWWGVVIALLAEHCGYTDEEMHEALKAKFLGREDLATGLMRIGSTAKLSTSEFSDLTDRVIAWAASEMGVVIPPPDREHTDARTR